MRYIMKFNPTKEQLDILDAFSKSRVLKINAVAGSGKTSTLLLLAEKFKEPSLYICFNKSIQEEAQGKFPEHVECRTTHSLAYQQYGKYIQHKLKRPYGTYKNVAKTSAEVAKYYNIQDYQTETEPLSAKAIASLVKEVVRRFQNSAEDNISTLHIPYNEVKSLEKNHKGISKRPFIEYILRLAAKLWEDRCNPMSPVLAEFDTYLKMWQLSKPVLDYGIVYLDEAQDSNAAILDVVRRQVHCKIVYVGDTYQSIYQFRGAINAMESIDAPTMLLSKSFRYGQSIADVAACVIDYAINIKGTDTIGSQVLEDIQETEEEYTYIFRTNASLLETAIILLAKGKDVYVNIPVDDFKKQLESTEALKKGDKNNVKHEDITPYSSWWDLLEASKEYPELARLVNIVNNNQVPMFINNLDKLSLKKEAKILMTTAHKSKGCEYKNVVLANDFPLDAHQPNPMQKMHQQELNLLYVACTRAINKLQVPALLKHYLYRKEEEERYED